MAWGNERFPAEPNAFEKKFGETVRMWEKAEDRPKLVPTTCKGCGRIWQVEGVHTVYNCRLCGKKKEPASQGDFSFS